MTEKTCEGCGAKCCKYVAMEIDAPEDKNDFENIKWYVAHKNISVFVEEDGTWNIEFVTPCQYLTEDSKCSIHEEFNKNPEVSRPAICKNFSIDQCPQHNEYKEDYRFENIKDIEKYITEVFDKGLHEVVVEEAEEEN